MKFKIFRWWELYGKKLIVLLVTVLTIGLIIGYHRYAKDITGEISFVISTIYALFLFIITIPYNKIDSYMSEKIYDRKNYYYDLKNLRDIVNATINKIPEDDYAEINDKIIGFRIFTGRDDESIERRLNGERTPNIVSENGFIFTQKLTCLECKFQRAYKLQNEKNLKKSWKKLSKYYSKSCKELDRNYTRLIRLYGGSLQNLIDRDKQDLTYNNCFELIEKNLKGISHTINDLDIAFNDKTSLIIDNQNNLNRECQTMNEMINDIDYNLIGAATIKKSV